MKFLVEEACSYCNGAGHIYVVGKNCSGTCSCSGCHGRGAVQRDVSVQELTELLRQASKEPA